MILFSLLSLVSLAIAYADNELHARDGSAHEKREYPQVPLHTTDVPLKIIPPYRPLVWGDFNVIHTTDSHGWLLGHQKDDWPEPNYKGTLGDFSSFVTHMKQIAKDKKVDLLLVDSGDLHDGTGLSDGYPAGGVDGHDSNKFLLKLPYDLMTIGNHELTNYTITLDMHDNFVPNMIQKDRYLTSNVNIKLSNGTTVPVGKQFAKFKTTNNRTVTSLGVLFDMQISHSETRIIVQPVAKMVEEQWFKTLIAEETDVFVLVGHMPVSCDNWPIVFNAIRKQQKSTPILIFGGHSHIRDCQVYNKDKTSMALQSGRFMETIGWMSANITAAKKNPDDINLSRRYLDANRVTYQYHTNTNDTNFDTPDGKDITTGLNNLSAAFDLSHVYGKAPGTYTWDQSPYPSDGSVLTLFEQALPVALAIGGKHTNPNIVITNSMVVRYDVFKGPFTKNDQLTAAPYLDKFVYVPNIKASDAKKVLPMLNGDPPSANSVGRELWGPGPMQGKSANNWTPGYVTVDNCLGAGDDTLHTPIPHYYTPKFIGSKLPSSVADNATVDLVFIDHIEPDVLKVLFRLTSLNYTSSVTSYTTTMTNTVLELYAQKMWNNSTHH